MPDDENSQPQPTPTGDEQHGPGAMPANGDAPDAAASGSKAKSAPVQRWLKPDELETLRGRLKKRFH